MVIHAVVLQTHTGAERQLICDTMVVLQVRRYVIRMVGSRNISCIGDMVPVNTRRQAHTGVPLLGKLIIQIAVIGQLRASRVLVRQKIHGVCHYIL